MSDQEPIQLWEYTRSHPDCQHCKTILQILTQYDRQTHLECPCICHINKKNYYLNGVTPRKRGGRATKKA